MGLNFVGKSPVASSVLPSVTSWDVLDLKASILSSVSLAKAQSGAYDTLEEAKYTLNGGLLEVQTTLSKTMLPMVVNATCERIIQTVLNERTGGKIQVKLLPGSPRRLEPSLTALTSFEDSFQKLRITAAEVNTISDKLSKQVEFLDLAFKKLSLGVSAWVSISEASDDQGTRYYEDIGYARLNSRWGIALRTRVVHQNDDDDDESIWFFADAPRQLRIDAIDKIPALIERMLIQAEAMLGRLSKKVEEIEALTATMEGGSR